MWRFQDLHANHTTFHFPDYECNDVAGRLESVLSDVFLTFSWRTNFGIYQKFKCAGNLRNIKLKN